VSNLDQYSHRPLEARAASAQPASRSVPWAAGVSVLFGGFMTQFGAGFFGFGMIFCWAFLGMADLAGTFTFMGDLASANGRVSAVEATNARENKSPIFRISYTFEDSQNKSHTGESYAAFSVPKVGDPVKVEYVPDDPASNRIEGTRRAEMPIWVAFVVIFPAIGMGAGIVGIRAGRRRLRMLYVGRMARGRLVAKEPTNTKINNQTVYKLTFEFTTPDGRVGRVSDQTHETARLEDESVELLLYNPDDINEGAAVDALPGGVRINDDGEITACSMPRALLLSLLPMGSIIVHGLVGVYLLLG
jgi:hypothetical protein